MTNSLSQNRRAILARLVSNAPGKKLGRTQVMKMFYFLQELKGVPLGYDFRLFTYGPFDAEVLSDLATATSVNVVKEETVIYPRSYGFEITPGPHADRLSRELGSARPDIAEQVDAVSSEFGACGAADLELRSTILFVDRERPQGGTQTTAQALAKRVREIKPHFSEDTILDRIREMDEQGWLHSIAPAGNR